MQSDTRICILRELGNTSVHKIKFKRVINHLPEENQITCLKGQNVGHIKWNRKAV